MPCYTLKSSQDLPLDVTAEIVMALPTSDFRSSWGLRAIALSFLFTLRKTFLGQTLTHPHKQGGNWGSGIHYYMKRMILKLVIPNDK